MKQLLFAACLSALATAAIAQDCGGVCSYEFWNQTPDQITAGLQSVDVNARDADGKTPLHWAVNLGKIEDMDTLIAAGADINAADAIGYAPLHFANPTNENWRALIKAGANVNATTPDMQTPLHFAAVFDPDLVQALIAAGADIAAPDRNLSAPIFYAAGARTPDSIPVLLAAGADVNVRNAIGNTPLFAAGSARYPDNIDMLLAAGADAAVINQRGETPLHWAVQFGGSAENILALLKAGVGPSPKDSRGQTAYDLAKLREDLVGSEALELLKAAAN
jgi:ankyrin repeat protein